MIVPENIENIIFDYDGVLGDSASFNKYACKQSARVFGIELTDEVYERCAPGGATIQDIASCIMSHHDMPEKSSEFISQKKSYDTQYGELVKLFQGVPEMVAKLKKNYKLAVNTGTRHILVDTVLKKHDIYDLFNFVIAAEDITKGKPDPESYLLACKKFKAEPKKCLVVEDGTSGVISAINAGCIVVGLTTTLSTDKLLSLGCHFVINSIDELMAPSEA